MLVREPPDRKMPECCIFCDGRSLAGEHVWPRWMRHTVPHEPGRELAQSRVHQANPVDEMNFQARWGSFNRKAKIVCKPCNDGWMEGLEREARPILEPLAEPSQRTAAGRAGRRRAGQCALGRGGARAPARGPVAARAAPVVCVVAVCRKARTSRTYSSRWATRTRRLRWRYTPRLCATAAHPRAQGDASRRSLIGH